VPTDILQHVEWRRFHDSILTPIRPDVAAVYCADEPSDFIEICRARPAAGLKLKAAGSHWSLSESTVSDDSALETNWPDPDDVHRNSGPARDLAEFISGALFNALVTNPPRRPEQAMSDPCLSDGARNCFFIHLKSGTRVYEAYSLMDDLNRKTDLAKKLNEQLKGGPHEDAYSGPWGFMTLGGAGGQTVFGALTTGTHGGDYWQRPIADAVVALHLVTDGGDHYWIEPSSSPIELPVADDAKLTAIYQELNGDVRFQIIRDNDIFQSVVVGVGRFGVVVSMVLRVVPQYCLLEHRRLTHWSSIKAILKGPARHHAFDSVFFPGAAAAADKAAFYERFGKGPPSDNPTVQLPWINRFLQIALHLSPSLHDDHRCGVTQRWFYPSNLREAIDPDTGGIRGRKDRGTNDTAGKTSAYVPPDQPDDSGSSSGTFISRACGNGSFIAGLLRELVKEIEQIIADNAVLAGGIVAGALAVGAGSAVTALATSICPVLAAIVVAMAALAEALDAMGDDTSLAGAVDTVLKGIDAIPVPNEIKVMLVRIVTQMIFEGQQSNQDYVAISYAVMDAHDYLDRSCFANAESTEIFFDASRPDVYCAFVDAALAFEAAQEESSLRFAVGYVSLRYICGSRALIAPSQFTETVAIEISGLRDASGSVPFVMNAVKLARNPMFAGYFHWGQYNPLTRPEVEKLYDAAPALRLSRWRNSLRQLTRNGALDGFSSDFTRRAGLEPF
jgi:hypothetical protein